MLAEVDWEWWIWEGLGLLSLPVLVALNAFFVAAEFALVAVRKTRMEELAAQGVKGAPSVLGALEHLDRSIAATQLGITFTSIALGWISENALAGLFVGIFTGLPAPWGFIARHSVAASIAFLLITFMHVVFGELIPKSLALQKPDGVALWVAPPLLIFQKLTRPLTMLMNGTGNAVIRGLGLRMPPGISLVHSVEELSLLIEDIEEAGILAPEQAELVQNVFRLSNKQVGDCMVPRAKMAALELATSPERILEAVRSGAHTRMPVYEGNLDRIVGIVNTKDLFYIFSLLGVVVLEDALYPALFLRPDENIGNALRLFRKVRRPMALVRDESGAIQGLITLEDVLEEIIGDIEDEHDRPTPKVTLRRRPAPKTMYPTRRPPEPG